MNSNINQTPTISPTVSKDDIWGGWSGCGVTCHRESMWYGVPGTQHPGTRTFCGVLAEEAARCHLPLQGQAAGPLWRLLGGKKEWEKKKSYENWKKEINIMETVCNNWKFHNNRPMVYTNIGTWYASFKFFAHWKSWAVPHCVFLLFL